MSPGSHIHHTHISDADRATSATEGNFTDS
jgi:hypothetical protein